MNSCAANQGSAPAMGITLIAEPICCAIFTTKNCFSISELFHFEAKILPRIHADVRRSVVEANPRSSVQIRGGLFFVFYIYVFGVNHIALLAGGAIGGRLWPAIGVRRSIARGLRSGLRLCLLVHRLRQFVRGLSQLLAGRVHLRR